MTVKPSAFSLSDFRKWMSRQKDKPKEECSLIGQFVEPKLGIKRSMGRMHTQEVNIKEMAEDFKNYGGLVIDVEKVNILTVEVDSGTFKIHRFFVKNMS